MSRYFHNFAAIQSTNGLFRSVVFIRTKRKEGTNKIFCKLCCGCCCCCCRCCCWRSSGACSTAVASAEAPSPPKVKDRKKQEKAKKQRNAARRKKLEELMWKPISLTETRASLSAHSLFFSLCATPPMSLRLSLYINIFLSFSLSLFFFKRVRLKDRTEDNKRTWSFGGEVASF